MNQPLTHRTKHACAIRPASESFAALRKMLEAKLTVAHILNNTDRPELSE
jgi:hypothetical protein